MDLPPRIGPGPLASPAARVHERLKVDRAQIRALTKVAVKARRAFEKAAKQAAQQGGVCPPAGMPGQGAGAGPQTPAALGVVAGGLSGGIENDCNIA